MTTNLDLNLLSIFVAVAEAQSFSEAARQLGLTKGTVSRAIAKLEEAVGASLLHRTTRQVALSTAGTALYERIGPHLSALGRALGELPERGEQPSGELRLTAPLDLGVVLLSGVVTRFCLRYPEVRIDLRLTNRKVDLVAEGFDAAIRASGEELPDSGLSARRLGTTEMWMYASPAYVARRGEPAALGDPAHTWISFGPMSKQLPLGSTRPQITSDDFFFLRELLRNGAGVGILPWFVAEPYVQQGALQRVLRSYRVRTGGFVLLYPKGRQLPRKVSAFRDFLVEALRAQPTAP